MYCLILTSYVHVCGKQHDQVVHNIGKFLFSHLNLNKSRAECLLINASCHFQLFFVSFLVLCAQIIPIFRRKGISGGHIGFTCHPTWRHNDIFYAYHVIMQTSCDKTVAAI